MRTLMASLAVATALASTVPVRAQAPDAPSSPRGAELFNRAKAAAKGGDYRAACPLFAESMQIEPQSGTLLLLADCEERVGRIADALTHWREAVGKLTGARVDEKFLVYAKQHADELEPRVPRLTLRVAAGAPPGTRVLRGGEELSGAALGVPMTSNPGDIEIVVVAPGRLERRTIVTLKERDRTEFMLELGAGVAPPTPTVTPPPRLPTADATVAPGSTWPRRHMASLILLGSASALAGAGLGLGARTWAHYDSLARSCVGKCPEPDLASLHRESVATNVLLGLAGATALASVIVFVESRSKTKSVSLAVDGAGGMLVMGF